MAIKNVVADAQALYDLFTDLAGALKDLPSLFSGLNTLQSTFVALTGPIQVATVGFSLLGKTIYDVGNTIFSGFDRVLSKIARSVDMIDPAAVVMLNYAFNDLMATIGEKLDPLVQFAVDVINRFADAMANLDIEPLVEKIVEVLGVAADAFFELLEPLMQIAESIASAVMPILEALMPLLKAIGELFTKLFTALKPLLDMLLAILVPIINVVIKAITKLVEALGWLIDKLLNAAIAAVFGMAEQLKMQIEAAAIRSGRTKTRAAAKRGVRMGRIEDISRMALEAAAQMGVGANTKRTADGVDVIITILNSAASRMGLKTGDRAYWEDIALRRSRGEDVMPERVRLATE